MAVLMEPMLALTLITLVVLATTPQVARLQSELTEAGGVQSPEAVPPVAAIVVDGDGRIMVDGEPVEVTQLRSVLEGLAEVGEDRSEVHFIGAPDMPYGLSVSVRQEIEAADLQTVEISKKEE